MYNFFRYIPHYFSYITLDVFLAIKLLRNICSKLSLLQLRATSSIVSIYLVHAGSYSKLCRSQSDRLCRCKLKGPEAIRRILMEPNIFLSKEIMMAIDCDNVISRYWNRISYYLTFNIHFQFEITFSILFYLLHFYRILTRYKTKVSEYLDIEQSKSYIYNKFDNNSKTTVRLILKAIFLKSLNIQTFTL